MSAPRCASCSGGADPDRVLAVAGRCACGAEGPLYSVPPRFIVERHGGRRDLDWRPVFTSDSYDEANELFSDIKGDMRQGGLRLVDTLAGGQRTERYYQAPTLRSRW